MHICFHFFFSLSDSYGNVQRDIYNKKGNPSYKYYYGSPPGSKWNECTISTSLSPPLLTSLLSHPSFPPLLLYLPLSLPTYLPPFPSSLPSPSTLPPTLPTFLPMWPSFPPYFHLASPPSFPSIPFSPFFLPLPFPFPLLPYPSLLLCSHPFCLTPFISPFIFSCLFPHPTPLTFPPVPVLSSFPSFCVSTPSLPPRLFCPLHSPLLPFPYFPSSSLHSILSSSAVPPPCLPSFALSILPLVFFLSSYCNFLFMLIVLLHNWIDIFNNFYCIYEHITFVLYPSCGQHERSPGEDDRWCSHRRWTMIINFLL